MWQLVRQLITFGVCPMVAAPHGGPYWARFVDTVKEQHMLRMPERKLSGMALFRLVDYARSKGVDILHSHGKGAGLYGRLASLMTGIPCVHTYHGIHIQYKAPLRQMYILLEKLLGRVTSGAIAVSRGEGEQVGELRFSPLWRLHVVPNGVKVPDDIQPYASRGAFRVVHISRFDPVQKNSEALAGIALALRRLSGIDDVEFILIGEGERLAKLKEAVRAANLERHFRFEGFQPNPRSYLQGAGCYLSTSRWEGMPLAVLEAMAEGVPVVASDVVGNRDAVEHGMTGFLFPLDDHSAAARQIMVLKCDGALRQTMSKAAHQMARERFSLERMARETVKVYQEVLKA